MSIHKYCFTNETRKERCPDIMLILSVTMFFLFSDKDRLLPNIQPQQPKEGMYLKCVVLSPSRKSFALL